RASCRHCDARWRQVVSERCQLVSELSDVSVGQGEPFVAAVTPRLDGLRALLAQAVDVLADGRPVTGKRRTLLRAALNHATDIHTWQSLVRDGGLSRAEAIALAAAMVEYATG